MKETMGQEHPWTLDTLSDLARVYAAASKLDEAEEVYKRALRGYENALGTDSFNTDVQRPHYVPQLRCASAPVRGICRGCGAISKGT